MSCVRKHDNRGTNSVDISLSCQKNVMTKCYSEWKGQDI